MGITVLGVCPRVRFQGGADWFVDNHFSRGGRDEYLVRFQYTGTTSCPLTSVTMKIASLIGDWVTETGNTKHSDGDPFTATMCVCTDSMEHVGGFASNYITATVSANVGPTSACPQYTFYFPTDNPPILQPDGIYKLYIHMKDIPSFSADWNDLCLFRHFEGLDIEEAIVTTVTLTYNVNGGSGGPGSQSCTPGVESAISTSTPTKASQSDPITTTFIYNNGTQDVTVTRITYKTTSHPFLYWTANQDGSGTKYGGSSGSGTITISSDTIIYAQYDNVESYSSTTAPSASRPGATFSGWYTSQTGGSKQYDAGDTFTPKSNKTYYGRFKTSYTVTYDDNRRGSEIDEIITPGPGSITYDVSSYDESSTISITLPTTHPRKYVYVIMCTHTGGATYLPTYTIYGSSSISVDLWTTDGRRDRQYRKKVEVPFLGWSDTEITDRPGMASDVLPSTITIAGDLTLYAVWGSATLGELPVYATRSTSRITIWSNQDPINISTGDPIFDTANYRLDPSCPWSYSDALSTSSPAKASDSIYTRVTVHAVWNHKVSVDANGGDIAELAMGEAGAEYQDTSLQEFWKKFGTTISHDYRKYTDSSVSPPIDVDGLRKLGYKATGFSTSSSGTSVEYQLNLSYSRNAPIHLYAVWTANSYVVTFRDGFSAEGHDIIKRINVSYGDTIPAAQVPVVGQTYGSPYNKKFQNPGAFMGFVGWTVKVSEPIYGDTTITALWEFTPIWIMVEIGPGQKQWVKYKPKEDPAYYATYENGTYVWHQR